MTNLAFTIEPNYGEPHISPRSSLSELVIWHAWYCRNTLFPRANAHRDFLRGIARADLDDLRVRGVVSAREYAEVVDGFELSEAIKDPNESDERGEWDFDDAPEPEEHP